MQWPRGRCERKWTACRKEKNNVNYGLEFRVLSFKEPWRSVILYSSPACKKKEKEKNIKDNPYLLTNITQNWGQTTSSPDLKITCTSDANTMNTFPLERDKKSERQKVHMCCDICPLYFRLAYLMFLKGRKKNKGSISFYGTNCHIFRKIHNFKATLLIELYVFTFQTLIKSTICLAPSEVLT